MASSSATLVFLDKASRSFVLALRSLWLHKMRAFLSVLGIIIGTGAVISLMAFGEGSMQDALEDIKRQGATNIIIRSVKPPDDGNSQRRSFVVNYGLTYADYNRLIDTMEFVEGSVPMRIFSPQEIRRLHRVYNGKVVATTQEYGTLNKVKLVTGRFLADALDGQGEGDDMSLRNVCVLGSDVASALFPFENPLGESIVLNKHQFVVVGVVADRMPTGNAGGSVSAEEFNGDVYIPLRTGRSRYGDKVYIRQSGSRSGEQVELHQITLKVKEMDQVRDVGNAVRDHLEQFHQKKDWAVTVPLDRLEEAERQKARFTQLLVCIAGISLLVGGIGIMNIMLATVTERTREIGIRRALGAKRRDITFQFLIEAVVQTSIGGMLGVGLGLAVVYGIPPLARTLFDVILPSQLNVMSIFLSLAVSIGVGVLFGLYPATRASGLDPIEALRHE